MFREKVKISKDKMELKEVLKSKEMMNFNKGLYENISLGSMKDFILVRHR